MAFSDLLVLQSLTILLAEPRESAEIPLPEISERAGVAPATAQRAVKRLRMNGLIEVESGYRRGYKYRICTNAGTST